LGEPSIVYLIDLEDTEDLAEMVEGTLAPVSPFANDISSREREGQ
jgi:hypothetical protein